ncbi:MAG: ABC transporter permease subunit [Ruminococcus sp.]
MDKKIQNVFLKRKLTYTIVLLVVLGIYIVSSLVTEFHLTEGAASFPKAFAWIAENLIPDEMAMKRFPKILDKLIETALLSVAVTVIAAIFAFFFSLFGSKATGFHGIINRIVRIVAAFFRNVPDVVWAMLLMFSFGQNILTGFFALFFTTFGLLTRAFIETIDEVSASCIEALHASGANFIQTVFQGIIPSTITGIVTWVLYMIETNIRSSTLIGILTATGIGYLFDMYYKRLDFSSASLVVVLIIVMVIVIETISNQIRKVIL